MSTLSSQLRSARQPRLTLEMGLLRMASLPDAVDIKAALTSLNRIERMAASGEVKIITERVVKHQAPAATDSPARPDTPPKPKRESEAAAPTAPMPAAEIKAPASSPPAAEATATAAPEADAASPKTPGPAAPAGKDDPAGPDAPIETHAPTEPDRPFERKVSPPGPHVSTPESAPHSSSEPRNEPSISPGPSLFGDAPAISRPRPRRDDPSNLSLAEEDDVLVLETEEEATVHASPEMIQLKHAWQDIVDDVMLAEKQLGSFLRHAQLTAFEGNTVLVSVPDDFHAKALRNERAKLAHRLTEGSGLHVERIGFRVDAPSANVIEAADDEATARETLERLCEENPAVRALVERFGGEIVW